MALRYRHVTYRYTVPGGENLADGLEASKHTTPPTPVDRLVERALDRLRQAKKPR